ncbi:hypothetical protein niasHT_004367 [Heterodera trifolii]|uniref:Ubiquitin-like domain-containing protein n=1 Tax=Heterodera trifolii TaxID=157864 RepID=A0ABD2MDN5_9BILA
MLLLLMIVPSSSDSIEIAVTADEKIFKKVLTITNAINVKMYGKDKVEDLKKKIMETMEKKTKAKYGSDFKRLTLKYGENDNYEILNDEKRINNYSIKKKGDKVHLSIGEFQIDVKQYEKKNEVETYNVWVKKEETVEILKKKIKNESGLEPDDQILKRHTTNGREMEDKKTLNDYGIENGTTTIILSTKFEITVTTDMFSNTITVKVNGTDTVKDLKKKIMEKESKRNYGIELEKISLQYGKDDYVDVLKDEKTIDDYPIKKGETVRMSIGEFQIDVKQYEKKNEMKNYIIWVKKEETVAILKKKIKNKSGIKTKKMSLQYGEDDDFLNDGKNN